MSRHHIPVAVSLCLVAALLLLPLPTFDWGRAHPILFREIENAGHPVLFAVVSLVILRFLSRTRSEYLWTFVACAVLGGATELIQLTVGRDGSFIDFFNDLMGTGAALLLHTRAMTPPVDRQRRHLMLALVSLFCAFAPLAWTCVAYVHRLQQLPLIWRDDSLLDRIFSITLNREYQGLYVVEPWYDWRAYSTLVIELENPNDARLDVTVRVHDRAHDNEYIDRFNESVTVDAHASRTVRVPIAQIETAPATRRMRLDQIAGVIAFTNDGPRRIDFLRSVRLEP